MDGGETVLAEGMAQTGDVQPVVTASGDSVGEPRSVSISAQAVALSSDDGSLTLELPADPQRSAGIATLQRLDNALPERRGDAVSIELPSRPTGPFVLKMGFPEAEAAEAAGQRIALRNADGSWLLLPAKGIDLQARVITTVVPAAALSAGVFASASAKKGAKAATAASAAAGPVKMEAVRVLAVGLRPAEASVRVGGTLRLMPYALYQGAWTHEEDADCDAAEPLCVPMPVLPQRELRILNDKPTYERVWKVEDYAGGSSIHGTVTLLDPAGAIYTAPWTRPNPSTVTVSFTSRRYGSDRTLKLSAKVHIQEDAWEGPMSFVLDSSDGLGGYYYAAQTRWVLDPTLSTPQRRVYRAQGTIDVEAHAGQCEIVITPSRQALGPDLGLSELVVNESQQPATYQLQLNTRWDAVWNFACAPGVGTATTMGAIWNVSGVVSDGLITGGEQDPLTRKTWRLSRPQ